MRWIPAISSGEPLHRSTAYGPSDFDLRNNFHFNALYHFPNFTTSHGFVNKFIDGWAINGILSPSDRLSV